MIVRSVGHARCQSLAILTSSTYGSFEDAAMNVMYYNEKRIGYDKSGLAHMNLD
jgi:hypothetical protein